MKKYIFSKKALIILFSLIVVVLLLSPAFQKNMINQYISAQSTNMYEKVTLSNIYTEAQYSNKIVEWNEQNIQEIGVFQHAIPVKDVTITTPDYAGFYSSSHNYFGVYVDDYYDEFLSDVDKDQIIKMETNASIQTVVTLSQSGLYSIALDYYDLDDEILPNEIAILINNEYQYYESRAIKLYTDWGLNSTSFAIDRYQNELLPRSSKIRSWETVEISDSTKMHMGLFKFYLEDGDQVTITSIKGEFLLGNITIKTTPSIPTYQEYLNNRNETLTQDSIIIPAEDVVFRNDPSIRLLSDRDPSATRYDTQFLKLNAIDGMSFQTGGQSIKWNIEVENSGYYQLSFKYRQYTTRNLSVFKEIKINDEVPYLDLAAYAFPYTRNWVNRTLVNEENEPLLIYLEAGSNTITLTNVVYPYRRTIESIREMMNEISTLSLDVKKITGNSTSRYQDWDIEKYLPHAEADMLEWADKIDLLYEELLQLGDNSEPAELSNLKTASRRLRTLASDINKLPSRLIQLSDGDTSVAQLIGDQMQRLQYSNVDFEKILFHGEETLPNPRANIFLNSWESFKRLVLSFVNNPYKARPAEEGELAVWVNASRQHIEIMQNLIDSDYDGPLKVTLSLMPDENKLILANATGQAPDVAIGVNHWIPYEFAIRGASLDLRKFGGYEELVENFSPGAMIPYVFEEGMFGIPLTQNFWITYYRRDILESIGIDTIPQTWEEVIAILPRLQGYGLNYFSPISQFEGFKPFVATLPYIYQFGGDLYTEDGMQTAINSEQTLQGLKLMTEIFTLHNMPQRVPNFYNHFRYGTLPIGISDLSTYILLTTAAPEVRGLWDIDLHPGVLVTNEDNTQEIVRYAATGAQASMILSNTKHKDAAWDFLSWWMSTEIQTEYAFVLQTTYGQQYFWNTANLNAFANLPIPAHHKQIILKQWDYAIEASRIPGAYMVEREISNAWNRIVFNGENPRLSLDEAVRISNREIIYKMEEFGYAKNGVKVKDYRVPSIYNIDYWLKESGDHD